MKFYEFIEKTEPIKANKWHNFSTFYTIKSNVANIYTFIAHYSTKIGNKRITLHKVVETKFYTANNYLENNIKECMLKAFRNEDLLPYAKFGWNSHHEDSLEIRHRVLDLLKSLENLVK